MHRQEGNIMFAQKNFALIGMDQADHHIKSGSFSRSVGPEQPDHFSLIDVN
jgi:hypothetical protein